MRWPWSKKRQKAAPVCDDLDEATQARRRAEEALRLARDRTGEIKAVSAQSRRHRRVNHFAQLIDETFRGVQ